MLPARCGTKVARDDWDAQNSKPDTVAQPGVRLPMRLRTKLGLTAIVSATAACKKCRYTNRLRKI
jgi:hypothetical protein